MPKRPASPVLNDEREEKTQSLEFPKFVTVDWPISSGKEKKNEPRDLILSNADINIYGKHNYGKVKPTHLKFGHCISITGKRKYKEIVCEIKRRVQGEYGMHVPGDWMEKGVIEVLENYLNGFNRLFLVEASHLRKWEWMEGLVTWLKIGDGFEFILPLASMPSCYKNTRLKEIFSMFIPMYIACIELLAEQTTLIVFNKPIITLLLIEFLQNFVTLDIWNVHEIVRTAEEHGLRLKEVEGINVLENDIEILRARCLWPDKIEFSWSKTWEKFDQARVQRLRSRTRMSRFTEEQRSR